MSINEVNVGEPDDPFPDGDEDSLENLFIFNEINSIEIDAFNDDFEWQSEIAEQNYDDPLAVEDSLDRTLAGEREADTVLEDPFASEDSLDRDLIREMSERVESKSVPPKAEVATYYVGKYNQFPEDDDYWDEIFKSVNDSVRIAPEEDGHVYTYAGIKVQFPYTAYRSQEEMMEQIMKGVTTGENCLLESPTGTGKTAAILCALLAWQNDCKDKREDDCNFRQRFGDFCKCQEDPPSPSAAPSQVDECPLKKRLRLDKKEPCAFCVRREQIQERSYAIQPRKIYYLTRTHSQIAQVVKQLKNTAYKYAKMTILSSREPTCITSLPKGENETVNDVCRDSKNKFFKAAHLKRKRDYTKDGLTEDEMASLPELEKGICEYFFNFRIAEPKTKTPSEFVTFQARGAWDLEDLKGYGGSCKLCPYFGGYAMHEDADIVFCSYNYLLDPSLREFTEIQFKDAVLVFDEAHNIEDICRDAYTFTFDTEKFEEKIRLRVDNLIQKHKNGMVTCHERTIQVLNQMSAIFKKWSDYIKEKVKAIGEEKGGQLEFKDAKLKTFLEEMNLTVDVLKKLIEDLEPDDCQLDDTYINKKGEELPFRVPWAITTYLKKLLLPLTHVCKEGTDGVGGVKDFKGYLVKTKKPDLGDGFLIKFDVISLNPAVGFRTLRDSAYSIIIASGTLTPLNSFAVELATKFKWSLQAKHEIPKENVFAAVLGKGPNGKGLIFDFKHQNDEEIQNEMGEALCKICETVPNGVLIFLPSYGLMSKLKVKWQGSVLERIGKTKKIFWEQSDKQLFLEDMERYKREVKGGNGWDGCVMFAVFRGKISEGIDFADEQARAVVSIGIPYANKSAPNVVSKMDYNDMRHMRGNKDFMSGFDWYRTQAFRAMNQGIGRCVRHKDDWGALILIDHRLMGSNDRFVSKWVRDSLEKPKDFGAFMGKLEAFFSKMKGK